MVATPSTMLELRTAAPSFTLPNTHLAAAKAEVSLQDYADKPVLVCFICNHCPYVVGMIEKFSQLAQQWQQQGVQVIAINSNDVQSYPADAPEKMTLFAAEYQFSFPYLFDQDQAVAKAYKAACTPDFFLFNRSHELVYRGQFDGWRPGNGQAVTGDDLNQAIEALINDQAISENQIPSMGCNIKWQAGNEPDYF